MENRGVLIGSIIFVFGSFILMIALLVYESYKSSQLQKARIASFQKSTAYVMEPVVVIYYSL